METLSIRTRAFATAGAFALAACTGAAHELPSGNWELVNGDSDETGFSPLHAIDTTNISKLGLAWSMDLPDEVSLEAAPVVVDGVLYFTGSSGKVYAVRGVEGTVLWTFDPKIWEHNPGKMNYNFGANRGVAYANGKIFFGALDGRLFALDARTGAKLWEVETTDPRNGQTVTGAPRTFNGKVIIGQGGADFGMRGYVTAFDQQTGKQAWRFYVVPGSPEENRGDAAMEAAARTWNGEFWKQSGGGGGPWDSITFDAELNRIYIGTANAYDYDAETRSPGGGDNLYTASIVALDADTGKYVWHYQVNPRDGWDFDATQQMTLATLAIAGKSRKVLMQVPKNGFFYVIDRESGKLISADQIAKQNWAERIDLVTGRPVEREGVRYRDGASIVYPSGTGVHSWMRMSFSPQTGLVYVPVMQQGVKLRREGAAGDNLKVGTVILDTAPLEPGDGKGALLAWDPVAGQARWKVEHSGFFNGGVLATSGGVIFQGGADGWFRAFDAAYGSLLWKHYVGMGIMAAPTTWSVRGKQFVSVLAGYGGSAASVGGPALAGWKYAMPRRLVTYALGGTAVIQNTAQPTNTLEIQDNPEEKLDPRAIAMGHSMFIACAACHGKGAEAAGGPAPDLRESGIPLDADAFYSVVHDGALIQRGMPAFGVFDRAAIEGLRQYIRAKARESSKN